MKRYNFFLSNVYNINKKNFAQELLETLKIVCDKHLKDIDKSLYKHCDSRE